MPPPRFSSIIALEDNNTDLYMECTEVLLRITRNILQDPDNPKYRSISLGSNVVTHKLLPVAGAIQCLFEMGFQEASDKLVLPIGSPLQNLKEIHDELIKRRELRKRGKVEKVRKRDPLPDPVLTSLIAEVSDYIKSLNNNFFSTFVHHILRVWRCEKVSLQLKALKCVPLSDLKRNVESNIRKIQNAMRRKEIEDVVIDTQELLLLELCKWYKTSFFQWVNIKCKRCESAEVNFVWKNTSSGKDIVEVYKCSACYETVLFTRYTDAEKLLETRCGRCGEWVHCFYLICRSLGWDVRFVVDETDHVWVEVFSHIKNKWIHCDPCENLIDAPLVYETGWKKNLSYIMAYSKDDIQDVTWRYSCNYQKLLENRNRCSEEELVDVICNVRNILLSYATGKRREFVVKRTILELVDLMTQRSATEAEKQGRSSGSLQWRLARGEITLDQEFKPYVWKLNEQRESLEFKLSYCTASDEYFSGFEDETVVKGWINGLYKVDSVFRKVEDDWKMVYLARAEGSDKGTLVWRFEVEGNYTIGDIELRITRQKYENGEIVCKLSTDEKSITIPEGPDSFTTCVFWGSKFVELSIELSGGCGNNAWQHAQIFRQQLDDRARNFEVIIRLNEVLSF